MQHRKSQFYKSFGGNSLKTLIILKRHSYYVEISIKAQSQDIKMIATEREMEFDASQGAGHANHARGNEAEVVQDPLSLPSGPITSGAEFVQDPLSLPSGPITRLRAKRFKDALKTKMGPNNDQGLVHVIKAIDEVN
jgi:hypothetical protein